MTLLALDCTKQRSVAYVTQSWTLIKFITQVSVTPIPVDRFKADEQLFFFLNMDQNYLAEPC